MKLKMKIFHVLRRNRVLINLKRFGFSVNLMTAENQFDL